jgi:hypothetical protein
MLDPNQIGKSVKLNNRAGREKLVERWVNKSREYIAPGNKWITRRNVRWGRK